MNELLKNGAQSQQLIHGQKKYLPHVCNLGDLTYPEPM